MGYVEITSATLFCLNPCLLKIFSLMMVPVPEEDAEIGVEVVCVEAVVVVEEDVAEVDHEDVVEVDHQDVKMFYFFSYTCSISNATYRLIFIKKVYGCIQILKKLL